MNSKEITEAAQSIGGLLYQTFLAPAERSRGGDVANGVDGLFAVARGLDAIATELRRIADVQTALVTGTAPPAGRA